MGVPSLIQDDLTVSFTPESWFTQIKYSNFKFKTPISHRFFYDMFMVHNKHLLSVESDLELY